jgi:hypothetical protein
MKGGHQLDKVIFIGSHPTCRSLLMVKTEKLTTYQFFLVFPNMAQGLVLGTCLFLSYINDLPQGRIQNRVTGGGGGKVVKNGWKSLTKTKEKQCNWQKLCVFEDWWPASCSCDKNCNWCRLVGPMLAQLRQLFEYYLIHFDFKKTFSNLFYSWSYLVRNVTHLKHKHLHLGTVC